MSLISSQGVVYLVGAGPGDPGLLTVRGQTLLAQADVVVYDYLANPELLENCPNAELIYAGKKAAAHSMTQEEINALLVRLGQEGKRVVRLKGGDPFVFGRGGEECEALAATGVRFEVVPGITAAIGGPCYAGIPVTHRDLNSSFTFITGHEKEEEYRDPQAKERGAAAGSSDVDWAVLAKLPCIAFYMGVKALPRICQRLIENGMDPHMPAAAIRWGTRAEQRTVVGTISDLPQRVEEAKLTAPAITIVGRVVGLRDTMSWFERRPLFGQTVVVTRTRQQASDLTLKLRELGAKVIEAPTIEIGPPADWSGVDERLRQAGSYDWIVFTSANGVTHTKQRLLQLGLDARVFGSAQIAAVGDVTADAVRRELCLKVDLMPARGVADALADDLEKQNAIRGRSFLLLRADIARPILRERLTQGSASRVDDVPVYDTRPAAALPENLIEAIDQKRVDWLTFTSSSTASNLVALLGANAQQRLAGVRIASIGPVTSQTLRELNLPPTVEATSSTIDGLVEAMLATGREG